MSDLPLVLVTGANGEIGHGLIETLSERGDAEIVALDLRPLEPELAARCARTVAADVADPELWRLFEDERPIDRVIHLAALLSSKGEREPKLAHRVNVEGTLNLLELAMRHSRRGGRRVSFLFPSTIAVYGIPSLGEKARAGSVSEDAYLTPTTMYGCNKLYCEHLGRYYARHYGQLAQEAPPPGVDFRGLRFPGLISAFTLPTGGTSDYAPAMVHAAARGEPYACFVREDTRIPFMAMPDAIEAIRRLLAAPAASLSRAIYNVGAFSPSAGEIARRLERSFPKTQVTFQPDARRQAIVDTWPESVDDAAARADWGFAPAYDFERALTEYLLPNVS